MVSRVSLAPNKVRLAGKDSQQGDQGCFQSSGHWMYSTEHQQGWRT